MAYVHDVCVPMMLCACVVCCCMVCSCVRGEQYTTDAGDMLLSAFTVAVALAAAFALATGDVKTAGLVLLGQVRHCRRAVRFPARTSNSGLAYGLS